MPTKIELTLESSQQGVSNDILVPSHPDFVVSLLKASKAVTEGGYVSRDLLSLRARYLGKTSSTGKLEYPKEMDNTCDVNRNITSTTPVVTQNPQETQGSSRNLESETDVLRKQPHDDHESDHHEEECAKRQNTIKETSSIQEPSSSQQQDDVYFGLENDDIVDADMYDDKVAEMIYLVDHDVTNTIEDVYELEVGEIPLAASSKEFLA
uniref:Uncharacterized protein n=1 Tax=Tanacetum cinerariifolium TaxID=118510 RepID=A0A6L2L8H8_TANCI|nr:hypothetical protein [Tanacetum cinerariifolium]